MSKVRWRVLAGVLALAAIGMQGQALAATPSTVTIGASVAPTTLDLTTTADASIPEALLYNVYEGLVKLDPKGRVVPLLAASWKVSANGRVYTFVLHKGVRFQNGDPLAASDVVYSIERVQKPPSGKPHPHGDD